MAMDWSARGRARVYALTVLGTVFCIAVAFVFDSYSLSDGWRWGSDPLNNLVIPLLVAPPFFFLLLSKMRQLAVAHRELMAVASTDSLTTLLNRRAFTEMVDGYLRRVEEISSSGLGALLIVDVDHFKQVNDRYGHDTGDEALKVIASTIAGLVRDTDLVARVGGEEFAVFIPGQSPDRISVVAERIRSAINEIDFVARGQRHALTVSVGGVVFDHSVPYSDLYRCADEHLYRAKNNGRNRVEMSLFSPQAAAQVTLH